MPDTNPLNLTDEERINEFLYHVSHAGAELPSGYKDGIALLVATISARSKEVARLKNDVVTWRESSRSNQQYIELDSIKHAEERERLMKILSDTRHRCVDLDAEAKRFRSSLEGIAVSSCSACSANGTNCDLSQVAEHALNPEPPSTDA